MGFLLDRWWEQKHGRLSLSTAAEYRRIIDGQVLSTLGKVKLSKLTVADLDALYPRLEKSGLAPSTVRQVHAAISGALKQAVKCRWIGYKPARDVSLPAARRHRIQPPDPAEVRALMAKAEAHSPERVSSSAWLHSSARAAANCAGSSGVTSMSPPAPSGSAEASWRSPASDT